MTAEDGHFVQRMIGRLIALGHDCLRDGLVYARDDSNTSAEAVLTLILPEDCAVNSSSNPMEVNAARRPCRPNLSACWTAAEDMIRRVRSPIHVLGHPAHHQQLGQVVRGRRSWRVGAASGPRNIRFPPARRAERRLCRSSPGCSWQSKGFRRRPLPPSSVPAAAWFDPPVDIRLALQSVILTEIVRSHISKLSTEISASGPLVSQSSPGPPAHFWFSEEYLQPIPRAMIQRARSTPSGRASSEVWLLAFIASFVSTFIENANAPTRTDSTKMAIITTTKAMPGGTGWRLILMFLRADVEGRRDRRARPAR